MRTTGMFLPLDSPQILEEQLNVCDAQNPNAGIRAGIAKTYIPLLVRDADPKVTFLFLGSLSKNLRSILFANPTWQLAPFEASMDVLRSTVANVLRVKLSCKAAASVKRQDGDRLKLSYAKSRHPTSLNALHEYLSRSYSPFCTARRPLSLH